MAGVLPPGFQPLMALEAGKGCGLKLLIRNSEGPVTIDPGKHVDFIKENENGLLQYIIVQTNNENLVVELTIGGILQKVTVTPLSLWTKGLDEFIPGHFYITKRDTITNNYVISYSNDVLEPYYGTLQLTIRNPTAGPITLTSVETKRWQVKDLPE